MVLVPPFDLKFLTESAATAAGPSNRRHCSPDRRRVLDAALGPEPVDAAGDAKPRAAAHIALEHLGVVADVADNAHHPILGQAELLTEVALDAHDSPDLRHVG